VGGDAVPVVGQLRGRFAIGERGQQGADELGVCCGCELAFGFERVAQAHEFFDAGDDAGLLGDGWHRNQKLAELGNAQAFTRHTDLNIHDRLLNVPRNKHLVQKGVERWKHCANDGYMLADVGFVEITWHNCASTD
jgi:hypothetical protein